MKWFCEIVKDFDGTYYANMTDENGLVKGLPEYVDYRTLSNAIKQQTGRQIVSRKYLKFTRLGRKQYAYINACFPSEEGCCMTYSTENMEKVKNALLR